MATSDAAGDWILRTEALVKRFGELTVIPSLDFRVRRNTVHALIGPNGAGKTTVFNLLTKFIPATSGKIYYAGRDITRLSPADVALLGLVRSFQISATYPELTARENVRIALQRPLGTSLHFWRSDSALSVLDGRADQLLESVGLRAFADARAGDLPYGRKRALEFATTLALDPDVMLLDEPMAGLTIGDIERVSELIREAAPNRTVVMVEHNLSVVAKLSNIITVLARGEVIAEGDYAAISSNPLVREAYLGSAYA